MVKYNINIYCDLSESISYCFLIVCFSCNCITCHSSLYMLYSALQQNNHF